MMFHQMSKDQLLDFINTVGFTAFDTWLFLDTHPTDQEAMRYFRHYKELQRTASRVYAEKYGPLTMGDAVSSDRFLWSDEPWPWEGGAC